MFDWETHQFILIPRHSSCRQWRAAPFGACLARRITKMAKHSNPVIRSLFISTVRLSLHRRICQNRHILFFCAPSSIVLDGVTLWVRGAKASLFVWNRSLSVFSSYIYPPRIKHTKLNIYVTAKTVSQLCNRAGCRLLVAIDCLLSGGSPAGQSYSQTGTDDNDRRNFHGR